MRIYISGKIGEEVISDATRQRFEKAQKMLEERLSDQSYVCNPVDDLFQLTMDTDFHWRQMKKSYSEILLYDLNWLHTCNAIYMLDGWKDSPGAQTEYKFAVATGKKIFYESKKDAINHLWDVFLGNPEHGKLSLSKGTKLANEYAQQHLDEVWLPIE